MIVASIVVAFALAVGVVVFVSHLDSSSGSATRASSTTTTISRSTTTTRAPGGPFPPTKQTIPAGGPITLPPSGASISGPTPCPATDGSSDRTTQFAQAPPMCIDPNVRLDATVVTNLGTFVISLDPVGAPQNVNSFVVLARYHFYDGIDFHRIVAGFVAQSGDANGTGGPGYRIPDELPTRPYHVGTVAIANAGPNTNGSQFFIVLGNPGSIPPQYPIIGRITVGQSIVTDQIGALGSAAGTPIGEAIVVRITVAG